MPAVDVLERLIKLPLVAFFDNAGGKLNAEIPTPVVAVRRGEMGCYAVHLEGSAAELNRSNGVGAAQANAMRFGSMFGWEVPGADPDRYDAEGNLKAAG